MLLARVMAEAQSGKRDVLLVRSRGVLAAYACVFPSYFKKQMVVKEEDEHLTAAQQFYALASSSLR